MQYDNIYNVNNKNQMKKGNVKNERKKKIKIKLSTVVYLFIIFALVIALGVVYYFGFVGH